MSTSRRTWIFLDTPVQQSFAWSLMLTMLPVVAAFAGSWVVARFAGPTVWGSVSWAMALATALLIVAKLGLELGASRLASELGSREPGALRTLYATALRMRALATSAVAVGMFAFATPIAKTIAGGDLVGAVRVAAGVVFCASMYEFHEQFIVGLNRHAVVSRVRALMLSMRLVATVGIVAGGLGAVTILLGYVAAWTVATLAFVILLAARLPRSDARAPLGAGHTLRSRLLAISLPLAISSASVTIYSQMDKLMLGYFDSVEEVGHYAIARAVVEVALFPAFALVMTLRPALASRYASGRVDRCAALFADSLRLAFVAGVLAASVFAALSGPLIVAVYSERFAYAGALMVVFACVIVLRAPGALILPALVAAERTRVYAVLTTLSAAVNFVLNLVLIPRFHARGAIVATVVSYGILLVGGLWQSFALFGMRPSGRWAWGAARTLLAGLVTAVAFRLISDHFGAHGGTAFVMAALQALVFAALVFAMGVVRRRHVALLRPNLLKQNV